MTGTRGSNPKTVYRTGALKHERNSFVRRLRAKNWHAEEKSSLNFLYDYPRCEKDNSGGDKLVEGQLFQHENTPEYKKYLEEIRETQIEEQSPEGDAVKAKHFKDFFFRIFKEKQPTISEAECEFLLHQLNTAWNQLILYIPDRIINKNFSKAPPHKISFSEYRANLTFDIDDSGHFIIKVRTTLAAPVLPNTLGGAEQNIPIIGAGAIVSELQLVENPTPTNENQAAFQLKQISFDPDTQKLSYSGEIENEEKTISLSNEDLKQLTLADKDSAENKEVIAKIHAQLRSLGKNIPASDRTPDNLYFSELVHINKVNKEKYDLQYKETITADEEPYVVEEGDKKHDKGKEKIDADLDVYPDSDEQEAIKVKVRNETAVLSSLNEQWQALTAELAQLKKYSKRKKVSKRTPTNDDDKRQQKENDDKRRQRENDQRVRHDKFESIINDILRVKPPFHSPETERIKQIQANARQLLSEIRIGRYTYTRSQKNLLAQTLNMNANPKEIETVNGMLEKITNSSPHSARIIKNYLNGKTDDKEFFFRMDREIKAKQPASIFSYLAFWKWGQYGEAGRLKKFTQQTEKTYLGIKVAQEMRGLRAQKDEKARNTVLENKKDMLWKDLNKKREQLSTKTLLVGKEVKDKLTEAMQSNSIEPQKAEAELKKTLRKLAETELRIYAESNLTMFASNKSKKAGSTATPQKQQSAILSQHRFKEMASLEPTNNSEPTSESIKTSAEKASKHLKTSK